MKKLLTAFSVIILFTYSACEDILVAPGGEGNGNYDDSSLKKFNVDLFEETLIAAVGNQWVGYAYVINKDGVLAHSGSQGEWVKNSVNANITDPVYGASINKLITAVATLKIMDEEGSGAVNMLSNSIKTSLPAIWNPNNNFTNTITIDQLLSHNSGIPTAFNSNYTSLQNIAENGIVNPANGGTYSNANYGFMRMFITKMNDVEVLLDDSSIGGYDSYVRKNIFEVIGINPVLRSSSVTYYNWNDNTSWDIGSRADFLGSGGYYISPVDMAKFLAYLNHTEVLLSKATRTLLYARFYGLSDGGSPVNNNGIHGTYYSKAGALLSNGRGVRNIVCVFPGGVEVVFMANSRGGNLDNTGSLQQAIFTAYDNAWE